jgi:hypothetical protein
MFLFSLFIRPCLCSDKFFNISVTLTVAGKTVAVGKVVAIPPGGSPTFSA